jgi:hypothetical protein
MRSERNRTGDRRGQAPDETPRLRARLALDAGDGVLIFIAIRISDGYTL